MLGPRWWHAPALAVISAGCSLLAPDDAHFVGGGGQAGAAPEGPCEPPPPCSELRAPDVTVSVAELATLSGLVADAAPGTTIALEPGTYDITGPLELRADGVTLRSTSGNAADTVVNAALPSLVSITSSDVTIAQLTLRGSGDSAIVLGAPPGERRERVRLCGVVIEDGGEHAVRTADGSGYSDCGLIEGSTMRLTDAGRTSHCCASCVPAALSIEGGRGWVVRGNRFSGFYCAAVYPPTDPSQCHTFPFSILFHLGARDTLIENNTIDDCSRGIGIGWTVTSEAPRSYPDAPYGGEGIDHYDGIVRNNVILGHPICFDTGMEINRAREPRVVHNTVLHLGNVGYAAIDRRFPTTFARVENNLLRGGLTIRDCGQQDCTGLGGPSAANIEVDMLETYFVLAAPLDPHLAIGSPAVDAGVVTDSGGYDIDGETHDAGAAPDVGADEQQP